MSGGAESRSYCGGYLEQSTSVEELQLSTDSDGWDAQFYVADEFGPNDRSFDLTSLGEPLDSVAGGGAEESVSLQGATGSQILIWITETGPYEDKFRFVLNEVAVG